MTQSKSFYLLFISCLLSTTFSFAQKHHGTINGTVLDSETKKIISEAAIQLYHLPDSAYISGVVTDDKGKFQFKSLNPSKYFLKFTFLGKRTKFQQVKLTLKKMKLELDSIYLENDAVLLDETVITAEALPVKVVGDTIVYSSDAYRLPEGALLEEFIKKIPGAKVDKDGKITLNGKEIKKIMIDGKEMMIKDSKIVLKNFTADMVKNIKAYEKESRMTEITGVEDGNKEPVIDLTIKEGMKKSWMGNSSVAYGSADKYIAKLMVNRFSPDENIIGILDASNTYDNDISYGHAIDLGINSNKRAGFDYGSRADKLDLSGGVYLNKGKSESETSRNSENIWNEESTYGKSVNSSLNKNLSFQTYLSLRWRPDSLTHIFIDPSVNISRSESMNGSKSLTSKKEITDNFEKSFTEPEKFEEIDDLINQRINTSQNDGRRNQFSLNFSVVRKFKKKGRNLSINGSTSYGKNTSDNYAYSDIIYYQQNKDSITNQHLDNGNTSSSYRVNLAYSEPLFKDHYLNLSLGLNYQYNNSSNKTFDALPPEEVLIDTLSQNFVNKYLSNLARISFRGDRKKIDYSIGADIQRQNSNTSYQKGKINYDTTIVVTNFAPFMNFEYKFNKQTSLQATYQGRTRQPNLTDIRPYTDYSNPLFIKRGNPDLKPSYSHSLSLYFNSYGSKTHRNFVSYLSFNNVFNSVSYFTKYDADTGVRTTLPQNINGNWNANSYFMFMSPLKNKKFNINISGNANASNNVSYLESNKNVLKNKQLSLNLSSSLGVTYKLEKVENRLDFKVSYQNSLNNINKLTNRETYNYVTALNTNVSLPLDINLISAFNFSYNKGMGENLDGAQYIWNLQVTKAFLKKKQAIVKVQVFDILNQQRNYSSSITPNSRVFTTYNVVNNYFLVHFAYRFNFFGK